jgi:LuxR family maltose regulon positive regulatory protein
VNIQKGVTRAGQVVIAAQPSHTPVTISRTRLSPPRIAGVAISRPELQARLHRALTVPLTVLVAPAGHGKTRTLAEWSAQGGCATAWLSLSPREAELTRFAAHLAAALDQAHPGLAAQLYRHLEAPDRLDPQDLGERFADALYDLSDDLILIIDDFHSADVPAVAQFMTGLILAGPARLHTVIATRRPPGFSLARMRAQGIVQELNTSDLRFSLQDTARLLHEIAGAQASPELAARIHAAVGGWPAAIRLLAVGIEAGGGFDAPSGSSAMLGAALLLDYLGEEVLSQLAPAQRNLLLLAALPERFNAGLLAALATAVSTPYRPEDLEALRSLDLFREVPGLDVTWYVYHPLFRDTFLRQLAHEFAAGLDDLHQLAATWFADNGHTREAVSHLVQAGDITGAGALIESRTGEAFGREDWQAIDSWLNLIPEPTVRGNPTLLLASAWVAFLSGRGGRLVAHLRELSAMSQQGLLSDDQAAQTEILAFGASVAVVHAQRSANEVAANVLPRMDPAHRYRYGFAHMMISLARSQEGFPEDGLARLEAFTISESARIDAASIRGFFGRVLILWHTGRLAACAQVATDMRNLARAHALPLSAGWAELLLANVAHERGDVAEAAPRFAAVIADADRLHFSCVREAFTRQIIMYQLEDLPEEADRALARLRELVVSIEAPEHLAVCDALAARLALFRGDLASARTWLVNTHAQPERFDALLVENPLVTRIVVLLTLGQPDHLAEARELLTNLRQHAEHTHAYPAIRDVLVLTAYLHELDGETHTATRLMREGLSLAAGEQSFHRLAFLPLPLGPLLRRAIEGASFSPAQRIALDVQTARLFAQPTPVSPRRASSVHTLTERELEVLQCLERRLTNDEIGQELFISTITARNHVGHICSKLGVSGRRAAVTAARAQGLLA